MLTFLPAGLLGIVVTSLAAAYMSTRSTQVNWCSSINVNDIYHRFLNREATERQQVWVGRLATVLLLTTACGLALLLENALQVFNIILQIGAGTGLLYILRWFWWRINAMSELVAMIASFGVALWFAFVSDFGLADWQQLVVGVGITTVAWLATAFLAKPTDAAVLDAFYTKIHPGGPGWKPVEARVGRPEGGSDLPAALAAALFGALAIYGALFATGFFLYGRAIPGAAMTVVALGSAGVLALLWRRLAFR